MMCTNRAAFEAARFRIESGLTVNEIIPVLVQNHNITKEAATECATEAFQAWIAPQITSVAVEEPPTEPPASELTKDEFWNFEESPATPELAPRVREDFKTIALRSVARGEARVLPIAVGGKNPLMKWKGTPIDTASTTEWESLAPQWVDTVAAQFPDANGCVIAKPDEMLFIDEDQMREFRAGYEAFAGEAFPHTFTTSARDNRAQSHWLQTDETRKLGNVGQSEMFSVRQRNLYVLAEGSQHKNGVDFYRVIDDSPIVPMPDKLVAYIRSITKRNKAAFDSMLRGVPLSGTDEEKLAQLLASIPDGSIPFGEHDDSLASIAGTLRQTFKMNAEQMLPVLKSVCERTCVGHGSDYVEMCDKIAHSVARYEIRPEPIVTRNGTPLRELKSDVQPKIAKAAPSEPAAQWGEPQPLEAELLPVMPFELSYLPVSLQPWVKDVAERMSVPLDFAGVCAIVTLAGVTGRRCFVFPKAQDKEWRESIALSGGVISISGSTKTPTWKVFVNIAIEQEADWRKEHAKKVAEYKKAHAAWERSRGAGPEPEEPGPARRLVLNDATPEKAHDMMEKNPAGLFYYKDELAGWLAELDKKGYETARTLYLAATNGNDFYTMDRIERGEVSAVMCFSVFGGLQPDKLRDFLNGTGNIAEGLVPRFSLLVYPDEQALPLIDRPADDAAKQQFRKVLRAIAELNAETLSFHFDAKAQSAFMDWLGHLIKKIAVESDSGRRSHLSKYKGALPKIAALFQLIDIVAAGSGLSSYNLIDLEHFQKAERLLRYLESHMHRVYGSIQNPIQIAEHSLAEHLKTKDLKDGFSVRDIKRKHWGGLSRPDVIEDALGNLEEKGWVRSAEYESSARGGRPTMRWEINPGVYGRLCPKNPLF
jgi:Protein of unknown function (DUF3987)/Bifunctional DNA primase/polymerase, N-terminal